jgi:hypothetical protein
MRAKNGHMLRAGIIILILLAPSICIGFKNEPTTFGGIKWGTNINDLSSMAFAGAIGDVKGYKSLSSTTKIGEARVRPALYIFYRGRLCSTHVSFKGRSNLVKLRKELIRKHGQPYRPWEKAERFLWRGNRVDIVLRYKEKTDKGSLIYWFKPIMEEKLADDREKGARKRKILN